MKALNRLSSVFVRALTLFFILVFFEVAIAQSDTLNVKYNTNPLYKYSSISEISEITFSADESELIFKFTDATTTTEAVSSIVEMTFDDSILGGGDPLAGLLAAMAVSTGWNMISIPLELDDMTKLTLFPTAVSKAWWYNNGYVEADVLEKGKAYWLKFDAPVTSQLRGTRFSGTVPVNSGWNMVGPYNDNIDTASIVYAPVNIRQSNFWGYNNGYFAEDTLKSSKGYWVKLTTGGTLDINGLLPKTGRDNPAADNNDWGRIIISDNTEKEVILYAAEDISEIRMNELPPPPPGGIFDARYTSGRYIEEIGENGKEIIINSAAYPVKIKVEGAEIRITANADGEELDRSVSNGGEMVIGNNKIKRIILSGTQFEAKPTRYYVYQNYPNPFNPSTKIRYEIPIDGMVRIEVYNILGEKVKELVNQELEAGYHEIEFRAENLASGAYIYRITASTSSTGSGHPSTSSGQGFVDVKKMMYLK